MTTSDSELLQQFARNRSEEAFAALVKRHIDLVYSAALRQVRSTQLAEDVSQAVFLDLSRNAAKLAPDTILTAWLYRVTRRTAIDVVRSESRRQLREQIAVELAAMKSPDPHWNSIAPLLDEAMDSLDKEERSSILLRYFENKSLREVGETLGTSDDAAQKRVSRAVERLREYFSKNGIAMDSSGFVALVSANAVQSAPMALTAMISTAAITGGSISAVTMLGAGKTLIMTTMQKVLITATMVVALGAGIYGMKQRSVLRDKILQMQQNQKPLVDENEQLRVERDKTKRQLIDSQEEVGRLSHNSAELIRLRGEVGMLREAQKVKTAVKPESLTLKIDPSIFKRNVMARADETMNTSSNHYSDILLDVLKMEGCDMGTNYISLDSKNGEISLQNSLDNLEIFQRVVEELNREDGQRGPFSTSPRREPVLIAAQIYKMDTADFEKLKLGKLLRNGKPTDSETGKWTVPQDLVKTLKDSLNSAGGELLSSPRVQTSRGIPAELSLGNSESFSTFKCLPIFVNKTGLVELKVQTSMVDKSITDSTGSAGNTNAAFFARTYLESGAGLIIRSESPDKAKSNCLVLFLEMKLL